MALARTTLTRVFMVDGVQLMDPAPAATVTDVVRILAASGRPDLATCEVRGPVASGGRSVYTLHRAVGTKGRVDTGTRKRGAAKARQQRIEQMLGRVKELQMAEGQMQLETGGAAAAFTELKRNAHLVAAGADQLAMPAAVLPCLG